MAVRGEQVPAGLVRALWEASLPEQRVPELPAGWAQAEAAWVPRDCEVPCPSECACWDSDGDGPCSGEWEGIVAGLVAGEPVGDGLGWSVPGVSWDAESGREMLPPVSLVVAQLVAAVERLGGLDPAVLPDGQVLVDAEALQALVARLRVLQLGWTAAVEVRDLSRLRGLHSTSGWLAVHAPDAVKADRTLARRLAGLPGLADAVHAGRVSLAAGAQVGKALEKVTRFLDAPDGLIDGQPGEQVVAAIVDNTVDLVAQARGGLPQDSPLLADLHAVTAAIQAAGGSMLARVEGAFTLLAKQLGAGEALGGALGQQVDAVLPNLLEQKHAQAEERRGLSLTPRPGGSWRLEGDLTPEVGEQLFTALAAEARRDPGNPVDTLARQHAREQARDEALRDPTAPDAGADPVADSTRFEDLPRWEREALRDLVGKPDSSHPEQTAALAERLDLDPEQAEELALLVPRSPSRRLHDALGRLLTRYLDAGLGGVTDKTPVQVAVTVSAALVEGRPGALPGRSARTGRSLARSLLRRWWGDAQVTTLLLSTGWQPLGVVHTERTLAARERQALNVQWDHRCAGTDCCPPTPDPLRRLIPHHVRTFASNGGRTSLGETLPCCERLHHGIHLGGKTLRLRDGRLLNEHGILEGGQ